MTRVRKQSKAARAAAPVSKECRHPESKRVDASSMGNLGRWICRQCGHRNWDPSTSSGQGA